MCGILCAIGGSLVIADPGGRGSGGGGGGGGDGVFLRGAVLLAVSPVAWASSLFVQKPLLLRYGTPFSLTAWTFAGGTAAMGVLAAALFGKQPDAWRLGNHEGLALLAAVLFGWCVRRCWRLRKVK